MDKEGREEEEEEEQEEAVLVCSRTRWGQLVYLNTRELIDK